MRRRQNVTYELFSVTWNFLINRTARPCSMKAVNCDCLILLRQEYVDFSLLQSVQTGSGAHSASYTMGIRTPSPGWSGRDVRLTIHRHLAPKLRWWGAIPRSSICLQCESWGNVPYYEQKTSPHPLPPKKITSRSCPRSNYVRITSTSIWTHLAPFGHTAWVCTHKWKCPQLCSFFLKIEMLLKYSAVDADGKNGCHTHTFDLMSGNRPVSLRASRSGDDEVRYSTVDFCIITQGI